MLWGEWNMVFHTFYEVVHSHATAIPASSSQMRFLKCSIKSVTFFLSSPVPWYGMWSHWDITSLKLLKISFSLKIPCKALLCWLPLTLGQEQHFLQRWFGCTTHYLRDFHPSSSHSTLRSTVTKIVNIHHQFLPIGKAHLITIKGTYSPMVLLIRVISQAPKAHLWTIHNTPVCNCTITALSITATAWGALAF